MTRGNPLWALLLLVAALLSISSCKVQSADAAPPALPATTQTVTTAQGDLALVVAAIEGVGASQGVEAFAQAQSVVLQPASGSTRQGEHAGTRLVLFHDAAGALTRADLYFAPTTSLHRAELETVSGPIQIFQQSKDSHGRAELAATETRPVLSLFAEFMGATPEAVTPVRSVSVRRR